MRAKIGDVYCIPLADGRFGYAQFVAFNKTMGYMVRVFDRITNAEVAVSKLASAGNLFPPVFTGLLAALKDKRWKVIGTLPVPEFPFPMFRSTNTLQPGKHQNWWIWEGGESRFIGDLPKNMRKLEMKVVWGYENLEERIATGEDWWADVI